METTPSNLPPRPRKPDRCEHRTLLKCQLINHAYPVWDSKCDFHKRATFRETLPQMTASEAGIRIDRSDIPLANASHSIARITRNCDPPSKITASSAATHNGMTTSASEPKCKTADELRVPISKCPSPSAVISLTAERRSKPNRQCEDCGAIRNARTHYIRWSSAIHIQP